jgi:hypothetical protein
MNDYIVEEEIYKGYSIEIYYDEYPESPREWSNLGVILTKYINESSVKVDDILDYNRHPRFILGEEVDGEPLTVGEIIEEYTGEKVPLVLPVYKYDHSGVIYRTTPFSCPWDSGQVGWIYATEEEILGSFGKVDEDTIERARQCLISEVQTFSAWANGEVYGFVTEKDGEHIDSCWGFYSTEDCLETAKETVDYLVKKEMEAPETIAPIIALLEV